MNVLDIGTISVIVNASASVLILWVMQTVTADAGLTTWAGLVKLAHRASMAFLSIVLLANAGETMYEGTDPRWYDMMTNGALFLVILLSALRHKLAPVDHHVGIT